MIQPRESPAEEENAAKGTRSGQGVGRGVAAPRRATVPGGGRSYQIPWRGQDEDWVGHLTATSDRERFQQKPDGDGLGGNRSGRLKKAAPSPAKQTRNTKCRQTSRTIGTLLLFCKVEVQGGPCLRDVNDSGE